MGNEIELATFGAGCFWCSEASFCDVKGVASTRVGYMGGTTRTPTYEEVCEESSGHFEVVEVTFDPETISYRDLLEVFWGCHGPGRNDDLGMDQGTQYRSVIFYHDEGQRMTALASKKARQASGRTRGPIMTTIEPASAFWKAEDWHQGYLRRMGHAQCRT